MGSVAPVPLRLAETERLIKGNPIDLQLIESARTAASAGIRPIDDIRSSARYRAAVAGNLVAEFLEKLDAHHLRNKKAKLCSRDGTPCHRRRPREVSCLAAAQKPGHAPWPLAGRSSTKRLCWPRAIKPATLSPIPIGSKRSAAILESANLVRRPQSTAQSPQRGPAMSNVMLALLPTKLELPSPKGIAPTSINVAASSSSAPPENRQRKSWQFSGAACKMTRPRNFTKQPRSSGKLLISG